MDYSVKELEHYQRVRQNFEGASKPRRPDGAPAIAVVPTAIDERLRPPTRRKASKRAENAVQMNGSADGGKGKGKGKAIVFDSDDDDDDVYVTSNDYSTPERRSRNNSNFGDGGDDGELYD